MITGSFIADAFIIGGLLSIAFVVFCAIIVGAASDKRGGR